MRGRGGHAPPATLGGVSARIDDTARRSARPGLTLPALHAAPAARCSRRRCRSHQAATMNKAFSGDRERPQMNEPVTPRLGRSARAHPAPFLGKLPAPTRRPLAGSSEVRTLEREWHSRLGHPPGPTGRALTSRLRCVSQQVSLPTKRRGAQVAEYRPRAGTCRPPVGAQHAVRV